MPGYIPYFKIEKGGEDITARFQDRTTEISIELASGNGQQDTCTITLDDRDWKIARPQVDDYIDISLGYKGIGEAFMGTFEIDEVTFSYPPKQIQIHGNAQGFNTLLKVSRINNYKSTTLGGVLQELGKQVGIDVSVAGSLSGQKIETIDNTASPQQFIGELERRYNAVAKISGNKLSFTPYGSGESASGMKIKDIILLKEHFSELSVKHMNRSDYGKTVVDYYDENGNRTPADAAISAVQGLVEGNGAGIIDKVFKLKHVMKTKEEAQALAKSIQAALDRGQGEGLFTLAEGDPWIRDQARILVTGTRDGIDGSYVADLVKHTYTKGQGIRTSIKAMPPSDGSDSLTKLLALGESGFVRPGPGQVVGEVLPPGLKKFSEYIPGFPGSFR